ncbi:histone deacetylase family protein [Arenimonas terrae]|uniref:Histone deacetylase family protein n=1 Tax=Arenimonas terrae TaxID=2546226 RepID=A0A5C4RWG1_9GAMM|nr:histone deacetylase family protein [Arenimonas terrae]TNJ35305.1 histone deacetylase family protein [Arenimonas terrae]
MLFYTHSACLAHDPGAGHPECPARLEAVLHAVRAAFPTHPWRDAPRAPRDALLRVHSAALVADVLDTPFQGSRRLDEDTALSADSPEAALRAAGAGIAAVDAVLGGEARLAFCAVRPPGHHATGDTAMGFCLFNAVAVAAAHALHVHGLQRVAIADFDVHHGNGSQDIFAREPRVMYVSSHQSPLYPNTGLASETGVGNLANAPLAPGAGSEAFRAAWSGALLPALDRFRPQLLLVSAGFDGHRLDPLADLALEADDYRWLGAELATLAARHADGRVVSMLEGGYSLAALRACSVAHLQGLGA